MHVTHSLTPRTAGRSTAGLLAISNQRHPFTSAASNHKDIPEEHVYEGELLEKKYRFDTFSGDRATRLFTLQGDYAGFKYDRLSASGRKDAIETYASYARMTGANLSVLKNILDIYV